MFWLLAFLIHNNAVTLFRMIGALARNLVVANALGALALLVLLLLGGFVLTKAYVHHWWIWACEPLPSPLLTTRLAPFLVPGETLPTGCGMARHPFSISITESPQCETEGGLKACALHAWSEEKSSRTKGKRSEGFIMPYRLGKPACVGTRRPAHQRVLCGSLADHSSAQWRTGRPGRLPAPTEEHPHRVLVS